MGEKKWTWGRYHVLPLPGALSHTNWIAYRGVGIFWKKSAHMVLWPFGLLKVLHGGAQSTHGWLVRPILHIYKFWYKLGSQDPT